MPSILGSSVVFFFIEGLEYWQEGDDDDHYYRSRDKIYMSEAWALEEAIEP